MLLKISLVIAMCSHPNFGTIQKRMTQLQEQNPGAQVSVRIDKKAVCIGDQVLTGKEAKLAELLK